MQNTITIKELTSKFVNWSVHHRSPRTVEWYQGHLNNFLTYQDIAEKPVTSLKPYDVIAWVDSKPTWGSTYKRGAIVAVQRLMNWAEGMGLIETTPLKKVEKPPAKRRETFMALGDFQEILSRLKESDPFKDLLQFVWYSGCRPQEVRHIERRHVDLENERIVFPAEESKGKRTKRIIYLQGTALDIIKRLMLDESSGGKLFLNNRGTAWTKYAICNRFHRLSKEIGKRMFCYAARHGFATRKLVQGHDSLTVAALMGHTDGSMLAKVYSHIDQDTAHLKKALAD